MKQYPRPGQAAHDDTGHLRGGRFFAAKRALGSHGNARRLVFLFKAVKGRPLFVAKRHVSHGLEEARS